MSGGRVLYYLSIRTRVIFRVVQDEILWCMLFVDDIVLVDEMRAGINVKLEL